LLSTLREARSWRWWVAWLTAVLSIISLADVTSAQDKTTRPTVIVYVEGPRADAVERQLVSMVPGGAQVAPRSEFVRQLRAARWRGPMGNIMAVPTHRTALLKAIRKAMRQMGASAAVIGRMRKSRELKDEVWLLYVSAEDETLLVDQAVPMPPPEPERMAALEGVLATPLSTLVGASEVESPEAEAEPAAEPPPVVTPLPTARKPPPRYDTAIEPPKTKDENELPIIDLFAGYELGARWFRYSDPGSLNLRPFTLLGANLAAGSLELYPLARTRAPVVRGLGLTASYARAFELRSSAEESDPIATTYHRFSGGLRLRFATGSPPAPVLGIRGAFGFMQFAFADVGPLDDELPAVYYRYLSGGLDVRLPLGRVAIFGYGDYLGPLLSGAVLSRFTDARIFGVDAGGGFSIAIAHGFEIRFTGHYTRFQYSFETTTSDTFIAGGARDELLGLQAGLAFAR
jgi:hypothetical protein